MLLLALSCLQGRPQQRAAEELLALGADGLQLTPGCAPTAAFAAWVEWRGVPVRSHDGFAWRALRRPVWSPEGALLAQSASVHPPTVASGVTGWLEGALAGGTAVEVMYAGWQLGDGASVSAALDAGLALAVDVSHLALEASRAVLPDRVRRRLLASDRVVEVHVSSNDAKADRHWPMQADSYGLDWARERAAAGTPVVCESYLHRLGHSDRQQMVDLVRSRVGA